MKLTKSKIKLPGTSVFVSIKTSPDNPQFTTLPPVHEYLFLVFLEELRIRYNQIKKDLGSRAKLKEALENNPTIEMKIAMTSFPFECIQIITAVKDFVSMGVTLWGKGWWGCYNVFLHASFPSDHEENPIIKVSVAIKVAKRLLA